MKSLLPKILLTLGSIALLRSLWTHRPGENLAGKVALITGGSRGLGLALARELARHGVHLEILARDAEELERTLTAIPATSSRIHVRVCDVTIQADVENAIREVVQSHGRLDLLINNAGLIHVGPLPLQTQEDFADAMQLHFWAPYHTMLAARPHLAATRGRIINIASIGGRMAVPHLAPYSASKFALVGLSDAFRSELHPEGISVLTVSPGLMRTGSHLQAKFKGQHDKEYTWFALGATIPGLSISAERAANQIIQASRRRQAELTITLQARAAVIIQALFPQLTARALTWVNRLLPGARGEKDLVPGYMCDLRAPAVLTTFGRRAARRLNEQPQLH